MIKITKKISIILICILLFLIFISKSVYHYYTPSVLAVMPKKGYLEKVETTSGIVKFKNIQNIYAKLACKISDIVVKEGEKVNKGQSLICLSYNNDDLDSKLKQLEVNKSQIEVEMNNINININKNDSNINFLKNQNIKNNTISDYNVTKTKQNLDNAKNDYDKNLELFNAGVLSKSDLNKLEVNVNSCQLEYNEAVNSMSKDEAQAKLDFATTEKTNNKNISDLQFDNDTLKNNLYEKSLEIKNIDIQKDDINKTFLLQKDNSAVIAPEDITIISLNCSKNQFAAKNDSLISFGISDKYEVTCDISLNNNFVNVGDQCTLTNTIGSTDGKVNKIILSDKSKKVYIDISSKEISNGETFDVKFSKKSNETQILVPNAAINKDSTGYFINTIKRRNGILGKEYYIKKIKVEIGDSDNENTIILKGIEILEPIVISSNSALNSDDVVNLKNEGDFFVK